MKRLTGTISFPSATGRGSVYRVYEINNNPVIVIFDEDMDMRIISRIEAKTEPLPYNTLIIGERKGGLTAIVDGPPSEYAIRYFHELGDIGPGDDYDNWPSEVFDYRDYESLAGHLCNPKIPYSYYNSLIQFVLPSFQRRLK